MFDIIFALNSNNDTDINEYRPIGQAMTAVIIFLHIGTTIVMAFAWEDLPYLLVTNGQSFQTKYLAISTPDIGVLGNGIPSTICTMLADAIIVSVTYFIIAYL